MNFEQSQMNLLAIYFFAQTIFGLFVGSTANNEVLREDKHTFLGNLTEGEYLLQTFMHNLAYLMRTKKGQNESSISFTSLKDFASHLV